jgi:hypothetical protein
MFQSPFWFRLPVFVHLTIKIDQDCGSADTGLGSYDCMLDALSVGAAKDHGCQSDDDECFDDQANWITHFDLLSDSAGDSDSGMLSGSFDRSGSGCPFAGPMSAAKFVAVSNNTLIKTPTRTGGELLDMTGVVTVRTPLLYAVTVKDGVQETLFSDEFDEAVDQVGRYKQSQRHGEEDPVSGHAGHHPSTSRDCTSEYSVTSFLGV